VIDVASDKVIVERIRPILETCANSILSLCMQPCAGGGVFPLAFLVNSWRRRPDLPEADLKAMFRTYLETESVPGTGETFMAGIGRLVENARTELARLIDPASAAHLLRLDADVLLGLSGTDALGDRLRELMAGLPPPKQEAKTNLGLPKPEEHGGKFAGLYCSQPFRYAQIDPLGDVYLCCPQTLPEPAGNLYRDDLATVWNSPKAQQIWSAILDGSFRFCSELTCGALQMRQLPRLDEVGDSEFAEEIKSDRTVLDHGPETMNLSYDRSCNLACPSCRDEIITLAGTARQRAEVIHDRALGNGLKDARRLIITGSGDPLGSRLYLSFLRGFDPRSAPDLRIHLSTNGLLLTRKMWESICHQAIDRIDVSVDAASPDTYRANRGGDFGLLVENLHFMGELRRSGAIGGFELHYVAQANNYREMADFVRLGASVGCDMVCFKQLMNWGTYTEADYLARAVQLDRHAEHEAFLGILADPIFRSPGVYMHDLSQFVGRNGREPADGDRPGPRGAG
jgi:MoaA/NifB/PqqE/SkfB family radical SAM enzyme